MDHPKRSRILTFITGVAMGAADVVPGVSGGTIALIFGVYERLLGAITAWNATSLAHLKNRDVRSFARSVDLGFVAALGLGIVSAILILTEPLSRTLDSTTGRVILYGFFVGLVVASIIAIGRHLVWTRRVVGLALAGTAIGFGIVRLTPADASASNVALFGSGAIAICATILPGISGSFILLILGQYENVIDAIRERNLSTIAIFGLGAAVGLLGFSRVLRALLRRYGSETMGTLTGFMAGSLWKIWPWRSCETFASDGACQFDVPTLPVFDSTGMWTFVAALGGLAIVSIVDQFGSTNA